MTDKVAMTFKTSVMISLDEENTDLAIVETLRRATRWMQVDDLPGREDHRNGQVIRQLTGGYTGDPQEVPLAHLQRFVDWAFEVLNWFDETIAQARDTNIAPMIPMWEQGIREVLAARVVVQQLVAAMGPGKSTVTHLVTDPEC